MPGGELGHGVRLDVGIHLAPRDVRHNAAANVLEVLREGDVAAGREVIGLGRPLSSQLEALPHHPQLTHLVHTAEICPTELLHERLSSLGVELEAHVVAGPGRVAALDLVVAELARRGRLDEGTRALVDLGGLRAGVSLRLIQVEVLGRDEEVRCSRVGVEEGRW